jgi:hypothetical protein
MKLFAAISQMLEKTVSVVDAVSDAIVTVASSADILAQAGKDMAQLAKNSTDQMLKEQQLEMRKDLLMLTRELEKEIVIEEGEFVTL